MRCIQQPRNRGLRRQTGHQGLRGLRVRGRVGRDGLPATVAVAKGRNATATVRQSGEQRDADKAAAGNRAGI